MVDVDEGLRDLRRLDANPAPEELDDIGDLDEQALETVLENMPKGGFFPQGRVQSGSRGSRSWVKLKLS